MLHLQGFTAAESARMLHWDRKRIENLVFHGIQDLRGCLDARGSVPDELVMAPG